MPNGLPPANVLVSAKWFFSLDTEPIQSAGYRFFDGSLGALRAQIPRGSRIAISKIVAEEVLQHQLRPVEDALEKLSSAIQSVERSAKVSLNNINEQLTAANIITSARAKFENTLNTYIKTFNGNILPLGDNLANRIFDKYFRELAPFENNKAKKHEFPDAATLITLEDHAESINGLGILTSNDQGWKNFCEQSNRLYCVPKVSDFTALFAAKGQLAGVIIGRLRASVQDRESALTKELTRELQNHVKDSFWGVEEFSTSSSTYYEGSVISSKLIEFEIDLESFKVWCFEHDHSAATAELLCRITVLSRCDVIMHIDSSAELDQTGTFHGELERTSHLEVLGFATLSGSLSTDDTANWNVGFDFGYDFYEIDVSDIIEESGQKNTVDFRTSAKDEINSFFKDELTLSLFPDDNIEVL